MSKHIEPAIKCYHCGEVIRNSFMVTDPSIFDDAEYFIGIEEAKGEHVCYEEAMLNDAADQDIARLEALIEKQYMCDIEVIPYNVYSTEELPF